MWPWDSSAEQGTADGEASSPEMAPEMSPNPARKTKGDSDSASPTRVLDFDQVVRVEDKEKLETISIDQDDAKRGDAAPNETTASEIESIFRDLTAPSLSSSASKENPTGRRRKNSQLKIRREVTILPTLDETTSSSSMLSQESDSDDDENLLPKLSGSSSEEDSEENQALLDMTDPTERPPHPQLGALLFRQSENSPRRHKKKLDGQQRTLEEQIDDLQAQAQDLALRGAELEALSVYKKALHVTKAKVLRVKKQLSQSKSREDLPAAVASSIQQRHYSDWLEAGAVICNVRTMMAILQERMGDFDRALASAQEARATYRRQVDFLRKRIGSKFSSDGEEMSDGADTDAKVTVEGGTAGIEEMDIMIEKIQQAKDSFELRKGLHQDVVRLRERITAVADDETDDDSDSTSKERKKSLYATVEETLETVRALELDVLGESHPQVGDTLSIMAALAVEQGLNVGLDHAFSALATMKLSLGMKHPRTGEKLRDIARIYETSGMKCCDDELAILHHRMAADVFRESSATLSESAVRVGMTLNDLAVLYIKRREFDEAITLLSDALESYERVDGDVKRGNGRIYADTVQIWRNLGECYTVRKEYDSAADAFSACVDVQRAARRTLDATKDNPDVSTSCDFVDDESLADTLRRLGNSLAHTGRYRNALAVLTEAHHIHRSSVRQAMKLARGRSNPQLPGKQDELAHTLFCLAQVHDALGTYTRAITLYSEALQFRLFADAHKPEKERSNLVHCAMALAGIGNVHVKKAEYNEAFTVFRDALNYCKAHGVPDAHPIVISMAARQRIACDRMEDDHLNSSDVNALEKLADEEAGKGNFDAALSLLRRVMAIRDTSVEQAVLDGKDCSDELVAAAGTLEKLASLLLMKGEGDSHRMAEMALRDAVRLYEAGGLTASSKCVSELHWELDRLEQIG